MSRIQPLKKTDTHFNGFKNEINVHHIKVGLYRITNDILTYVRVQISCPYVEKKKNVSQVAY
jgi:hypothetical protein